LVTPNRKRSAVTMLRERFGVSERRACTVVGIHLSVDIRRWVLPPHLGYRRVFVNLFEARPVPLFGAHVAGSAVAPGQRWS
jgi:hypothetical protein